MSLYQLPTTARCRIAPSRGSALLPMLSCWAICSCSSSLAFVFFDWWYHRAYSGFDVFFRPRNKALFEHCFELEIFALKRHFFWNGSSSTFNCRRLSYPSLLGALKLPLQRSSVQHDGHQYRLSFDSTRMFIASYMDIRSESIFESMDILLNERAFGRCPKLSVSKVEQPVRSFRRHSVFAVCQFCKTLEARWILR